MRYAPGRDRRSITIPHQDVIHNEDKKLKANKQKNISKFFILCDTQQAETEGPLQYLIP